MCKSFFRWSACASQIHTLELKIDFTFTLPPYLFFLHSIKRKFSINSHNNLTSYHQLFKQQPHRYMQYSSAALLETPEVHLFLSHSEKCKLCVFQCILRKNTYICVAVFCNNLVVIVQDLIKVTTEELASVMCGAEIRGRRWSIPADFRWL